MDLISPPTERLLALSMLSGVGPATLRKVAALPAFVSTAIEELAGKIPAIAKALTLSGAWDSALEAAGQQIREAQRYECRIISAVDAEYPDLLAETKDDPFILYVRGKLASRSHQSVAVIGTREPTAHGEQIAARISKFFVEQEWSVVSGLAIGCDAIAHKSVLESGGHTVAVLAHGHQTIAPARHRNLADEIIAAGGALVTEYPFGREVQRQQYVKRDRIQAGLSQGVVMIQSDLVGGSLHASRAALDYKRWLAIPYPTDKDKQRNEPKIQANLLLADGADWERTDLLRCPVDALRQLKIIKSREDYFSMLEGSHESTRARVNMPNPQPHRRLRELDSDLSDFVPPELLARPPMLGGFDLVAQSSAHEDEQPCSPTVPVEKPAPVSITETEPVEGSNFSNLSLSSSILQVPEVMSRGPIWTEPTAETEIIWDAISARLSYLDGQLIGIEKSLKRSTAADRKQDRLRILLLTEDFLSHMERATDLLLSVEESLCFEPTSFLATSEGASDAARAKFQSDVRERPDETKQHDLKFVSTLSELVMASAHRLLQSAWDDSLSISVGLPPTHEIAMNAHAENRGLRIELGELIEMFNRLVARVLYAQA